MKLRDTPIRVADSDRAAGRQVAEAKFRDVSIAYEHLLRLHKDPPPGPDAGPAAGGSGAGGAGGPAGRAGEGGGGGRRKSRQPREDEAHCINC